LLAQEVKLEEEDKALLLLSSLPSSYDILATTIMYGKETLELEDVRKMLQNNELIKKTDSTEEASGLFVKDQRGRSKSKGPKRDLEASSSFSCYFYKKPGHIKKNCMKYKEILKRKGGKDSDGASTTKKLDRARVIEEADEDSCDVLMDELGKGKYSDAWLLDSGCTYSKREWFSTYKPYDGGSVLMKMMPYGRLLASATFV